MIELVKSAADKLIFKKNDAAATSEWRAVLGGIWSRFSRMTGIDVVLPDGTLLRGVSAKSRIVLKDWRAALAFVTADQPGLFECYLNGQVDLEPLVGDAAEGLLSALGALDDQWVDYRWATAAIYSSRHWWQRNTPFRRAALSVHYSVPALFWLSFLSKEYPIYSHYIFEDNESHESWEIACQRKLEFALRACKLKPGDRVLNVGEGWGGFLAYAGRRGIRVTGVTLNDESYLACADKMAAESLQDQCEVIKGDFYHYRASTPFDAITNMGVTEHLTDYDALMAKYASLLKPGGYVYCDFVGTTRDTPFRSIIQKDVYPGATAVNLRQLIGAVQRNGCLDLVEAHDDRLSYDKTCVAWARNVEAQREFIVAHFGERRYRWIWSYLWMCVYGFRTLRNGITGTRVVLRRR